MTVEDLTGVIEEILRQNGHLLRRGFGQGGGGQLHGTVDGVNYTLGMRNGTVPQLYSW